MTQSPVCQCAGQKRKTQPTVLSKLIIIHVAHLVKDKFSTMCDLKLFFTFGIKPRNICDPLREKGPSDAVS